MTIETQRLLLRPFERSDAERLTEICNNYDLHIGTFLPYPYRAEDARKWLSSIEDEFEKETGFDFAIIVKESGTLIGCVGAYNNKEQRNASMGYWLDEKYWGNGYATEAARAFLGWLFEEKDVHKVCADHFGFNKASGAVMKKLGMTHEGTMKEQIYKDGKYHDVLYYGIINPWHSGKS